MNDLVKNTLRICAEDPMWDAHAEVPKKLLVRAANRIEELEALLRRCRTVLGNMTIENVGASSIFNRWQIHHEPLRNDARELLPIIDEAFDNM